MLVRVFVCLSGGREVEKAIGRVGKRQHGLPLQGAWRLGHCGCGAWAAVKRRLKVLLRRMAGPNRVKTTFAARFAFKSYENLTAID